MDLRATLGYALAREREGFAFFAERAQRATHASVRATLERLAQWEEGHERFFRELHDRALAEYEGMPWGG